MRWNRSASAVFLLAAALALGACGGGEKTTTVGAGGCTDVTAPAPRDEPHLQPPTNSLNANETYRVLVETNCGDFTITLDQRTSPKTTASFESLVRQGYFDHTIIHRIAPEFVIQGGDPTAAGSGGPGYTTVEAPPKTTKYVRDTVAMAKTETEPPGSAGSQFFVVTGADAHLPPDYAVLGKVTSGQDVVARIGELGDVITQKPTTVVEIEKMSVQTS